MVRGSGLQRDTRGPRVGDCARRDAPALLTLPQNFNAGWEARLRGHSLRPQQVDGWKQGWVVPAGAAGVVTLRYAPTSTVQAALVVGAVLVLLVLLLALPLPRRFAGRRARAELPGLSTGRPGVLAVAVWLGGLVGGSEWWAAWSRASSDGVWGGRGSGPRSPAPRWSQPGSG